MCIQLGLPPLRPLLFLSLPPRNRALVCRLVFLSFLVTVWRGLRLDRVSVGWGRLYSTPLTVLIYDTWVAHFGRSVSQGDQAPQLGIYVEGDNMPRGGDINENERPREEASAGFSLECCKSSFGAVHVKRGIGGPQESLQSGFNLELGFFC